MSDTTYEVPANKVIRLEEDWKVDRTCETAEDFQAALQDLKEQVIKREREGYVLKPLSFCATHDMEAKTVVFTLTMLSPDHPETGRIRRFNGLPAEAK